MRLALPFVLSLLPLPSAAMELELLAFYDLNRPASLEYDPAFCGLWIANEGPETILVTLDGLELRRWRSDLYRIQAMAIEGDHLIVADGLGQYQRVSKDGEPLGDPFRLGDTNAATEGLVVLEDGTLVIVEDDPARILWVTPDGDLIREVDGTMLDPALIEPQGIAYDPRSETLLIVDDWEGENALFEFTLNGDFIAMEPLIAYGRDPEGIAIRPGTDTLFMAFDTHARIASFRYTPTIAPGDLDDPHADCMLF